MTHETVLGQSLGRALGMMGGTARRQPRRTPLPKTYNYDPKCRWCVDGRSHSQRQHNGQIEKRGEAEAPR